MGLLFVVLVALGLTLLYLEYLVRKKDPPSGCL